MCNDAHVDLWLSRVGVEYLVTVATVCRLKSLHW